MLVLTSDIREAVRSRCHYAGGWAARLSYIQLRACWTSLFLPHAQIVAMPGGCHPYHSTSTSLNAPLCRVNPCSSIGRVFNHATAPCSCARVIARCVVSGSAFIVFSALLSLICLFLRCIDFRASFCSASVSAVFSSNSPRMDWTRDLVTVTELENACSASSIGIPIPSPPIFVGRLKSLLSASLMFCFPVMAGITLWWITSSMGCKMELMSYTDLIIYDHWCWRLCIRILYADWR